MENKLKVVVQMVTYNHEDYIVESIESVINQKTNFPFVLIISEDCSTDKTRDLCIGLKKKHPNKIQLILSDHNMGVAENSARIHKACMESGATYVAICEGDDYWCDPLKLQKQVDFLDNNPEYSICFHRVYELRKGKLHLSDLVPPEEKDQYDLLDLAKRNFIHTPSALVRNYISEFPAWFSDSPAGDYPMYMLAARRGLIKYFPEPMAVYRLHPGSAWSSQSKEIKYKKWASVLKLLLMGDFSLEVKTELRKQKSEVDLNYITSLLNKSKEQFLAEIDSMLLEDPGLAAKLIKGTMLNYIWDCWDSKSYKVIRQIGRFGRRFMK